MASVEASPAPLANSENDGLRNSLNIEVYRSPLTPRPKDVRSAVEMIEARTSQANGNGSPLMDVSNLRASQGGGSLRSSMTLKSQKGLRSSLPAPMNKARSSTENRRKSNVTFNDTVQVGFLSPEEVQGPARRASTPAHALRKTREEVEQERIQKDILQEQLRLSQIRAELTAAKAEAAAQEDLLASLEFDTPELKAEQPFVDQEGADWESGEGEDEDESEHPPCLADMPIEEAQDMFNELFNKVNAYDAESKELQMLLMKAERLGQDSRQMAKELEADLQEQEEMMEAESAKLDALKADHEELGAAYDELEQRAQTMEAENSQLQAEQTQLQEELESLYIKLNEKDAELAEKQTALDAAEATVAGAEEEAAAAVEEVTALREQLAVLKATNEQLDGALEAQEAELRSQSEELARLRATPPASAGFEDEASAAFSVASATSSCATAAAARRSVSAGVGGPRRESVLMRNLQRDSVILMSERSPMLSETGAAPAPAPAPTPPMPAVAAELQALRDQLAALKASACPAPASAGRGGDAEGPALSPCTTPPRPRAAALATVGRGGMGAGGAAYSNTVADLTKSQVWCQMVEQDEAAVKQSLQLQHLPAEEEDLLSYLPSASTVSGVTAVAAVAGALWLANMQQGRRLAGRRVHTRRWY